MQIYKLLTLVAQELLALPQHMSSPPVFSEVCVARSFVFCVMFCRSLFVLLSFFFWPLCCLWCTKSDYHFGIFKLFLRFLCEIIIPLTKTTKLMQLSRSWLQSIENTVLYFLPNRSSYLIEYVHFDPKKNEFYINLFFTDIWRTYILLLRKRLQIIVILFEKPYCIFFRLEVIPS